MQNSYFDQIERSGHGARCEDLDLIASLGVRTVRYPILWERTAPEGVARATWGWADERLARLAELGLRPIVGLLHHGSGPRYTSLLDPGFPEKLAAYARAVAERYPWVDAYTPVNEPLTTARFSGLYGHWFPHASDSRSFAEALLLQCRGIVLAMRAIREVNPHAVLVQTEDLGEARSTPPLAYQARFENERRWLTFDLLLGRVDRDHGMWRWMHGLGIEERLLAQLVDEPCPPEVLGLNYYVTSERYLDHRVDLYPGRPQGGNDRDRYVDVEAVRVASNGLIGVGALLDQGWRRYQRPLALTEAHLGGTREEQLRWLRDLWLEVLAARAAGADVRAFTAWAIFGSFDWHNLVTRPDNVYEPGAFDVRGPAPRATALAALVRELAAGQPPGHPVLAGRGWWCRDERLFGQLAKACAEAA